MSKPRAHPGRSPTRRVPSAGRSRTRCRPLPGHPPDGRGPGHRCRRHRRQGRPGGPGHGRAGHPSRAREDTAALDAGGGARDDGRRWSSTCWPSMHRSRTWPSAAGCPAPSSRATCGRPPTSTRAGSTTTPPAASAPGSAAPVHIINDADAAGMAELAYGEAGTSPARSSCSPSAPASAARSSARGAWCPTPSSVTCSCATRPPRPWSAVLRACAAASAGSAGRASSTSTWPCWSSSSGLTASSSAEA